MNLKVSNGNSKMGRIPSVSLPAFVTCRHDCECSERCYAAKLERLRPSVRQAYHHNYELLKCNPDVYWRETEATIMMSRFFRFHVSGDIPDNEYFRRMIDVVTRNPHCQVLCFTKKYEMINKVLLKMLDDDETLPSNFHLVYSAWRGLKMDNPLMLPEAHVRYRDGTTTAGKSAHECGGNCTDCAMTDGGCWTLKHGEQVVFNEH